MTMHTKASNAWKTVRYVYAKVSGSWQNVGQIYCKSGGTWYPVWSYSWTTGSYGSCSADCGGGTQTRSVTCTRNDGYTMDDAYCTKFVGTKPATSQSCNTQECEVCPDYCEFECTECEYGGCSCSDGYNYWRTYYCEPGENFCNSGGNSMSVVYHGSTVAGEESNHARGLTEITSNGYLYVRGTLRCEHDSTFSTGGSRVGIRNYYDYCFYPV